MTGGWFCIAGVPILKIYDHKEINCKENHKNAKYGIFGRESVYYCKDCDQFLKNKSKHPITESPKHP